jgi:hypothetical protein
MTDAPWADPEYLAVIEREMAATIDPDAEPVDQPNAAVQIWTPDDDSDRLTDREFKLLLARAAAKQRFRRAQAGPPEPFDIALLSEVMDRPAPPQARIANLIPWNGTTLITAAAKTGKSTLVANLAHALITGEAALGELETRPIADDSVVAILNFEMLDRTLGGWLSDRRVPADRLLLVNLRGGANPLASPDRRADLAVALKRRHVETIIVDTFAAAYDGESQNDAGEVRAWLEMLGRFKNEVGALDLILTTHSGWSGDRARGSSALYDWPDSIVTMVKNESGDRFIAATGRDVDLEEDKLDYGPRFRSLILSGQGNRHTAPQSQRADGLIRDVTDAIDHHYTSTRTPMPSVTELVRQLQGRGIKARKADVSAALIRAEEQQLIEHMPGNRGGKAYYPSGKGPRAQQLPGTQEQTT